MNKQIGTKECPNCKGEGRLPVYLAPLPCEVECAKRLSPYEENYWLCFKHTNPVPNLWSNSERNRCLKELNLTLEGQK